MRIVGGRWRGRRIGAPQGRGTRPTQERIREAMASIVASARALSLEGASILDPFAGSGALSLEFLSRGAAHATLIERDARTSARIRSNIDALGAKAQAKVVRGDAHALIERGSLPGAPFDIVLLDPPYAEDPARTAALVQALADAGDLVPGALIVHERAADAPGLPESHAFELSSSRRYGDTALDLWLYA